jgi:hypothetical protein
MNKIITKSQVAKYINNLIGRNLHQKQSLSIANAVYGAMDSSRLSISALGRSYAQQSGKCPKHGIKQVDRLIGNEKIDINDLFDKYVPAIVANRKKIVVTMDWTEFDSCDQSRIAINLLSHHGRATPLVFINVEKSSLKKRRTSYEKKALRLLRDCLPPGVVVIVLADRGFCSTDLLSYIKYTLEWDYIIRLRGNILFFDEKKHSYGRMIEDIKLIRGDKMRTWHDIQLTGKKYRVPLLVATHDSAMKEPWYVASSVRDAELAIKYYGKRFTCEEQFRDEKDDRFGAGSKETRVSDPERRDMLTFIHALATFLLTLIGEAGERIGYHKKLKANTAKYRTHSLYRQGKEYYAGVMKRYVGVFRRVLSLLFREHHQATEMFGVV